VCVICHDLVVFYSQNIEKLQFCIKKDRFCKFNDDLLKRLVFVWHCN
jgi:hypothetical protein